MSRLLGPPVTVAPPKQEKKVFGKKNYAFDSNDSYNEIVIIRINKKSKKEVNKKL